MVTIADVMRHVNNYFVSGHESGRFAIVGGAISLPKLKPGQYYSINGSVFNDGVHNTTEGLVDEDFHGEIVYMDVKPDFIALVDEINAWEAKYGEAANSPFTSESFGGYSYSKREGSTTAWYNAPSLKAKLASWRKI